MNVYLPNLRLPSAYQEVEYIQSSGTNGSSGQYINTGIIPEPANTVVKLRTMPTSSSYSIYLCSCMKTYGTAQTNRYYGLSFTANRWHCGYGTDNTTPGHPLVDFSYTWNWGNAIYDVEYRNDDLYVNSTLVANATTNVSNFQYPMFLFARNNSGTAGSFSSFRLYSCQIYKSGTLVRDFVPCYRKSDSVIGLYDLANNQFYTNAGSGTFSKGNDVTMAVMKNAYIGEVFEYSYDFRNKSIAICQNDGWTFSTTSGRTFSANGITGNSTFGTIITEPSGLSTSLSTAKKITMVIDVYITGNRGWDLISSSNSQASGSKSDQSTVVTRVNGTDIYSGSYSISSNEYKVTTIIDLVNKKISINIPGIVNREDTITDAQIAAVKTLSKLRIQQDNTTIKSVSITVE